MENSEENLTMNVTNVIIAIVVLVIGLTFLFLFYNGLRGIFNYIKFFFSPLTEEQKFTLFKDIPYYKKLNNKDLKKFERRVAYFIDQTEFIPRNLEEVTLEMKTLIAATVVQLTMGLEKYIFNYFDKILIYPDVYYSTINKNYHKGEVNPGLGVIVLSWKDFSFGNARPEDSKNLGMHEIAHALMLEDMMCREYDQRFFSYESLNKFYQYWELHKADIQSGKEQFFRDYADSGKEELFAVASECFFERPRDFAAHLPELYTILKNIYQQDRLAGFSGTSWFN